jgi:hypothetical protein
MADTPSSQPPRRIFKAKLNRWQFVILNLVSGLLGLGSFFYFGLFHPQYFGVLIVILIFLMIVGYVLRILRFNDISAETQINFLKSGNMFFAQGWLLWLAPSSSSVDSSWNEVASFMGSMDRGTRMKLIGRNLLRYFLVLVVLIAIIFAYNYFQSSSQEKALENLPPTTANFALSLGNNESTTLSMTVPGEYSTDGFIFPAFSTGKKTPTISFYSQPATEENLNNLAQQTILNTETQQHYADGDQITTTNTTSTFLGYPAWIITSTSDRPAKTIVFQVGSSTNMIEIEIIYSSGDPASEHQQVDGIINSIKIAATSSSQVIDTSGWQTYHNAVYGYTISYPSDASVQYNTLKNGNTEAGIDTTPAVSPTEANQIVITINTSTFPDALTDASVDIMPSDYYVGATGMGIGDKIVTSTFVLTGVSYPASGIDSSNDDGSIFMDAQVGKVEVGYAFSSADLKPIGEPEFLQVQNELLAIIGTLRFDK